MDTVSISGIYALKALGIMVHAFIYVYIELSQNISQIWDTVQLKIFS